MTTSTTAPELLILDRDGVINKESNDFVKSAEEWQPLPGAIRAIADISKIGIKVCVCTNQSGIGRGLFHAGNLSGMHRKMFDLVRESGGEISLVRYCPHHPSDGCRCRKPKPGMVLDITRTLSIPPEESWFVGDSLRDLEAAAAAGCVPILVRSGNGARLAESDHPASQVYDDLSALAAHLKSIRRPG